MENQNEESLPKLKTIGLFGGWSGFHVGDDAILIETLCFIQTNFPEAKIFVFSSTPEVTHEILSPYNQNIEIVPALRIFTTPVTQKVQENSKTLVTKFYNQLIWLLKIIHLYSLFTNKQSSKYLESSQLDLKQSIEAVKSCQLMIYGGGGYLNSDLRLSWLYPSLAKILICKQLRIPVYLSGHTIGPLIKRDQFLARLLLPTVLALGVRENLSMKVIQEELGIKQLNLIRERDAAWNLKINEGWEERLEVGTLKSSRPNIGISLQPRDQVTIDLDVKLMITFLEKFQGFNWILFPHTVEDFHYQSLILEHIQNANQSINDISIFSYQANPKFHKAAVSSCKLCVGTRFHFHVFAISSGLVSIVLARKIKTIGLLEDFGLGQFCFDFGKKSDSIEKIVAAVEVILANQTFYTEQISSYLQHSHLSSHLALEQVVSDWTT